MSAPGVGRVDLTSGMQQRQVSNQALELLLLVRSKLLLFLTFSIAVRGGVVVGAPFRLSTPPTTAVLVLPLVLPRLRTVLLHFLGAVVKIRPPKACKYPNLRSFGRVSYDKVGVLYSGKLESRSEARASDLRSYPGLWWKRIKLYIYEGKESEYSPRTCLIGRPAGGTLCPLL